MPRFTVYLGREVEQVLLLDKDYITIGRHAHANIIINHRLVSRRHAAIRRVADGYQIEDFGTANGVFTNGRRIQGKEMLQPRDRIGIGKHEVVFEMPEGMKSGHKGTKDNPFAVDISQLLTDSRGESLLDCHEPDEHSAPLAAGPLDEGPTELVPSLKLQRMRSDLAERRQAHLRAVEAGVGKFYPLDRRRNTLIGKSEEAHIVISGGLFTPGLCAEILKKDGGHVVRALSKLAKVKVNGKAVKEARLDHDDLVEIGKHRFKYCDRV